MKQEMQTYRIKNGLGPYASQQTIDEIPLLPAGVRSEERSTDDGHEEDLLLPAGIEKPKKRDKDGTK